MSQSWPRGGDPQAAKVSGTPTDGQGLAYDASTGFWLPVDLASTATFATDAELAAGLATKQDAATAATDAELSAHASDTTAVHGITDTSVLATDTDLSTHASDTTSVHGITDTTVLATDAELAAHAADTTSIHGITDTGTIAHLDQANTFTAAQTIVNGVYGSFSGGDIAGLLSGSTSGALIQGGSSLHMVIALRENDANDSFAVVSGGGEAGTTYADDATWDKLILRLLATGQMTLADQLQLPDTGATAATDSTPPGLRVGASYALHIQKGSTSSHDASIWHNGYIEPGGATATPKAHQSHASFGTRGITMGFGSTNGIIFYADSDATTAGSATAPAERMRIRNDGVTTINGTLYYNGTEVATEVDYGDQYSLQPSVNGGSTNAAAAANRCFYGKCQILSPATITGILYLVGATQSGSVRSALYNAAGTRVANRTTNSTQPAALNNHYVAFDAAYAAAPGVYFLAVIFSSSTATFMAGVCPGTDFATQGSFLTPATVVPVTNLTAGPIMGTY